LASSLIFLSTFPNKAKATLFARRVVTLKYAACVNILGGVESHYRWKKKIHRDKEVLVIGKCTPSGFSAIKKKIKSLHPYEVPELIAFKIADGLPAYLKWLSND
jgi:periplasmic divalent cation tolerance protein